MSVPSFSRQTEADTADERPTVAGSTTAATPVSPRRDDTTATDLRTADLPPAPKPADHRDPPPAPTYRTETERAAEVTTADRKAAGAEADRAAAHADRAERDSVASKPVVTEPVVTGPKPRASLLATLGLIFGVVGALLVLSGPLLGYGIGVAGLGLILSLLGIRATGKRHVAGKTDALIGMVLSLAAIVVGVLALTGSLSWLGTDMQPVSSLREWLDTQFANRF